MNQDDTMIRITVNGEPREVAAGANVADVLEALGDVVPTAVATALNGDFVARSARAARTLRDGDALFVFQPVTGG